MGRHSAIFVFVMRLYLSFFYVIASIATAAGQKNDYLWPLGLDHNFSAYRFFLDFHTDPPSMLLRGDSMSTGNFSSAYSSGQGDIIAYSNGLKILNKNGELIENAFGLNPTLTQGQTEGSYGGHQSGFFIENPVNPDFLYFVHLDNGYHPANGWPYRYIGRNLMVTTLDINANGGAGKAVAKNEILLSGEFMVPAAVRHGNGRDWWILMSDADENRHYRFLLTPEGFVGPDTQYIGTKPNPIGKNNSGAGNSFSPNGRYYVDNNSYTGFSIFEFDRCSGLLSNERRLNWPEPIPPYYTLRQESGSGIVFSPNERLLYVTATYDLSPSPAVPLGSKPYLFQFDLEAPDLATSIDTVNPIDPLKFHPYALNFEQMLGAEMGPDGRIYITHNFRSYSRVLYPDVRGKGCKFVYDEPDFGVGIAQSMPVFPNYRLGPLDGSPCDTLGIDNLPSAYFRIDDTLGPLARFFHDLSYGAPLTWHWDFGDGTMSQDTSSLHTYAAPGPYQVCLTVANANGSDTYCRDISITTTNQQTPVQATATCTLSPNPATDYTDITWQLTSPRGSFTLYDGLGRTVVSQQLNGKTGRFRLDVAHLPAGFYFYRVNADKEHIATGKLAIRR